MQRALGAILLLVLAGCLGSPPSSTSSSSATTTPPPPHVVFDGAAALDFVKGFALHADGSPRYRMPGTAGQAEGAAYLWANTDVPGWARTWQNFTGADYLALNRSSVADYGPGSPYCPQADLAALPSWPFHNLLAVRSSGRTGAPLLLLGAHWDSQMHSDAERNATRKSWPDPGANDGASGVGVLLQLMHQLNATLPFDVGILFIDGEDGFFDCYPIAGALQFVQHPPVAVRRFILLDMVGDPAARFARERNSMASDPDLMDALWLHGKAAGGADLFSQAEATIDDDHVAFIQAGIPSVDLIDAGRPGIFPPQWDTTGDTVDKLSSRTLGVVGQAILDTLGDPQLSGPWP